MSNLLINGAGKIGRELLRQVIQFQYDPSGSGQNKNVQDIKFEYIFLNDPYGAPVDKILELINHESFSFGKNDFGNGKLKASLFKSKDNGDSYTVIKAHTYEIIYSNFANLETDFVDLYKQISGKSLIIADCTGKSKQDNDTGEDPYYQYLINNIDRVKVFYIGTYNHNMAHLVPGVEYYGDFSDIFYEIPFVETIVLSQFLNMMSRKGYTLNYITGTNYKGPDGNQSLTDYPFKNDIFSAINNSFLSQNFSPFKNVGLAIPEYNGKVIMNTCIIPSLKNIGFMDIILDSRSTIDTKDVLYVPDGFDKYNSPVDFKMFAHLTNSHKAEIVPYLHDPNGPNYSIDNEYYKITLFYNTDHVLAHNALAILLLCAKARP